jgi:hypothetical protein
MLTDEEYDALKEGAPDPTPEPEQEATGPEAIVKVELQEARDRIAIIEGIELEDQQDLDSFSELLTHAKSRLKYLEKMQKEYSGPAYKAYKKIHGLFKPGIDELKKLEKIMKGKIEVYVVEQRKAREAAFKTPAHAFPVDEPFKFPEAPVLPDNISERATWVFEVEDINVVPMRFLKVDEDVVKAEIEKLGGEKVAIPGVRVYQKTSLAVRS